MLYIKIRNYIFPHYQYFSNKLKHILYLDFIISLLCFGYQFIVPLLIYDSANIGGLDKFGFDDIQQTAQVRADAKLIASIAAIVVDIFSIIFHPKKVLVIASIIMLLKYIVILFMGTSIKYFIATLILGKLSVSLIQISTYRLIALYAKQSSQKHQMPMHSAAFIQQYALMNFAAFICSVSVGYIRIYLGYKTLFIILLLLSILNIFYILFIILPDEPEDKQELDNQEDGILIANGKPTKHTLSLCSFIVVIAITTMMISSTEYINKITIIINIIAVIITMLISLKDLVIYTINHNKKRLLQIIACTLSTLLVTKSIYITMEFTDVPLTNWIENYIKPTFFNIKIPAETFHMINPMIIFICGAKIGHIITQLKQKNKIKGMTDLLIGVIIITIGMFAFLYMHYEYKMLTYNTLIGPILYFITITIGEVISSPIVTAYQTLILPPRFIGTILGVSNIVYNLGNKTLTVIPHQSFTEHNILLTFYLGMSLMAIIVSFVAITTYSSIGYITQITQVKSCTQETRKTKITATNNPNKTN